MFEFLVFHRRNLYLTMDQDMNMSTFAQGKIKQLDFRSQSARGDDVHREQSRNIRGLQAIFARRGVLSQVPRVRPATDRLIHRYYMQIGL